MDDFFIPAPDPNDFDLPDNQPNDDLRTVFRFAIPRSGLSIEVRADGDPVAAGIDFLSDDDLAFITDTIRAQFNIPETRTRDDDADYGTVGGLPVLGYHMDDLPVKGRLRKRGSLPSIRAFVRKIPGWRGYFSVIYDIDNDEYVLLETSG